MQRVMDVFGNVRVLADTAGMLAPVQCTHCGEIYDLTATTSIARFADCDIFKAPCCGRQVDDRRWKSLPDIREVS